MMIYPPIAKLVEKTGSRYSLVIETAKRARQLSGGAEPLTKCDSNKEVSIATNEIFEDRLEAFEAPVISKNEISDEAEPTEDIKTAEEAETAENETELQNF